jgi:hypothetical protein
LNGVQNIRGVRWVKGAGKLGMVHFPGRTIVEVQLVLLQESKCCRLASLGKDFEVLFRSSK